MSSADVIVLVTDLRTGVTANDQEVAVDAAEKRQAGGALRQQGATRIGEVPPEFYEFYNLGLGDPIPVSSVHGHGTGDLLDAVLRAHLTSRSEEDV